MGVQTTTHGRALIATLTGELDHMQAERLRAQIDAAFEKSPCKHVVFDMSNVSFMDSSGIGMIIGRYKNAEKRGGQIILANMSDAISRLYDISGLAKIVGRTSSVQDAVEVLGGEYNG